jgi:hypothetical protein
MSSVSGSGPVVPPHHHEFLGLEGEYLRISTVMLPHHHESLGLEGE